MDQILTHFHENSVVWMLVMFIGVLFWAFRDRFRRKSRDRHRPGIDQNINHNDGSHNRLD